MEIPYDGDDRNSAERTSKCMKSYFTKRSQKTKLGSSSEKRSGCTEPSSKGTSIRNCFQCSSKQIAEDDSDISSDCNEAFKVRVPKNDEDGSGPLRLKIRLPRPFQKGSPCSENGEKNKRDRFSLRLRIQPPQRKRDSQSLNAPNKRYGYEYTRIGKENKGQSDVPELIKGLERRNSLEQFDKGKRKRSDYRNRLRSRMHGNINPSTIYAHDKVSKPFREGKSTCHGAQNGKGTGCARTEYFHMHEEMSRVSLHRAVRSEKGRGLFIAYDSRRKRTDPNLADLYVSKSHIHGLGVFPRNSIQKGATILEFFGEIVRESVSNVRERRYLDAGMQNFYMFSLVSRGGQADRFCLDSTRKGGIGRFINHCCLPNTQAETHERGIVIRTIRNVGSGEEITLDYKMREGREKCRCRAENCSGVLGGLG